MSLRWCESPGNAARTAALSADQAPTAIIGCPHMNFARYLAHGGALHFAIVAATPFPLCLD
jgi:hypothetical protein